MKIITLALVLATLAALPLAAARRDPLTGAEADQLRETAQLPLKRLALMFKFAKQRLDAVDQLRTAPNPPADRGPQMQVLLEEFGDIVDELNQNIDTYAERKDDLRKVLKSIVEGGAEVQAKLQAVAQLGGSASEEAKDYSVTLANAMDSMKELSTNASETLKEQEVLAKEKMLKKP
jgi:methyl-accepting chemotaxis protein